MRSVHYYITVLIIFSLPACNVRAAREIYVHAGSQERSGDGSAARPFRTINEALKVVNAGDTVIVREGLYRESVRLPGGQTDKPISLRAAEGERVVLSGAVPVTGWEAYRDNIYVTELDFRPQHLLVNGRSQPVARQPNEGWWTVKAVEDLTIIDAENLIIVENDLVGGEAYVWTSRGNVYFTVSVVSLDRVNGRLTVIPQRGEMILSAGDRYYLKNHPSLIESPGEWAVLKHGDKWKIFFQPVALADLEAVEAPCETRCILGVQRVNHVRVSGLEITAGAGNGIEVNRAEDVIVDNCVVHNHDARGILIRDVHNVTIQRCISLYNTHGIMLVESEGVVVEENEIGYNSIDGLVVSWESSDITVQRNYIHHHLLWGHPDNMQLYREVKNIRIIDNLFLAGGQSIMMSQTSDGLIKGNMIVGCMAYSVIFGHKSAQNYRIHNNTIAFSGYGCMSLTARDYDVRENVFMTGQGTPMYAVRGIQGYEGDRNLFFNARGIKGKPVMASDRGWHRTFREYRGATGYDRTSVFGDPRFRNAPVYFAVIDGKRLNDCSRERLYLRGGELIRLGSFVEVNFDGVLRKVIGGSQGTITISPALQTKPVTPSLICGWERNSNLSLDLRLTANSPGAKLNASGGPVGSTIDVDAYQRGDFDADGVRDLPAVPPGLQPEKDQAIN
ncbi:right-handed parallel beta-helix repeat-containing protein [Planctomycetota bacterium]